MAETNLFVDIVGYEYWSQFITAWFWMSIVCGVCPVCGGTPETCTCGTINPNKRKKG